MTGTSLGDRVGRAVRRYAAPLRFSLRLALATVLAFVVARLLNIPLHGLWAVLTAVAVTQMSIGESVRATAQYVVGTLGGVVYASALALAIPHESPIALGGLLALTMAPLAFASALSPSFRVAPFTGALVLLIAGQLGEGPIQAAIYRLLEVVLGGGIAVTVSVLVLPEQSHELGLDMGVGILKQLADGLPKLLAGFTQQIDASESLRLQRDIGQRLADFQAHAASTKEERLLTLVLRPDPEGLLRNLLRLRNDLVMIGRAGAAPLPANVAGRLGPRIARVAASAGTYLDESAQALAAHRAAPPLDSLRSALDAFTSELTALRNEGVMRGLSIDDVERTYTLSFALVQLEHDLSDLEHCVEELSHQKR